MNRPRPSSPFLPGLLLAGALATHAATPVAWQLREPAPHHYTASNLPADEAGRLRVVEQHSGRTIAMGHRLLLRAARAADLPDLLQELSEPITRTIDDRTVVLAFPSSLLALNAAARLSSDARVEAVSPSRVRSNALPLDAWGPVPNDPYFPQQWHLEPSRGTSGAPTRSSGLEFRTVWPRSTGASILVAIVDDGVDATHPELRDGFRTDLARNWFTGATNPAHMTSSKYHGTAVAGLVGARRNNARGVSGAAPDATLTASVIFDSANNLPETEELAAALQHRTDLIPIQNHSWGNADLDFLEAYLGERIAVSNAVTHGRNGLGTIIVRAAGNTRFRNAFGRRGVGDANLDGFANEPGAITVAGLRRDGSIASYSAPGACILVAAPGGEVAEASQLFTLDPVGDAGNNRISTAGLELADYLYGSRSAAGTSFATPLVSGLAALALDLQPGLSLPDLHRILALASVPIDLNDPDLATNRAGLLLSHNIGFGTPEPSLLLDLVQRPTFTHPPAARTRVQVAQPDPAPIPIPDDGFRVVVQAPSLPSPLSFAASGGTGRHPDDATAFVPLVDAGVGASSLTAPVTGAAALLQRLPNEFADKIRLATEAGAALVIIANSDPGNSRLLMQSTDDARIPAALVGNSDGASLRSIASTVPNATARLELNSARVHFKVTNTLSIDWVQVRLRCEHPRMGDLRITLTSPAGTVSVLHRPGTQTTPMISEWWYSSKRHLLESSAGTWTLAVTDQATGMTGSLVESELVLQGIPILDTDTDGLDDDWEQTLFGSLAAGPEADPDADGWSNAAEAFLGQSPLVSDRPLSLTLHPTETNRYRLSWPARPAVRYQVLRAASTAGPWTVLGETTTTRPTASWFLPESLAAELFRLQAF